MAGAALLRAAARMAQAPPRLLVQDGLQHNGRRLLGPGPSHRLSSYASTPPSTNPRLRTDLGPQTPNKKARSEWDLAKAEAIETVPKVACFVALSGCIFMYFCAIPSLDHMKDSLDAASIERSATMDEIKHSHQRIRDLIDSKGSQSEARDFVGQGKETDGHQGS